MRDRQLRGHILLQLGLLGRMRVCNAPAGACNVLAAGAAGVGCGAYVCNGSSSTCPTTCSNDADCTFERFLPQRDLSVAQSARARVQRGCGRRLQSWAAAAYASPR